MWIRRGFANYALSQRAARDGPSRLKQLPVGGARQTTLASEYKHPCAKRQQSLFRGYRRDLGGVRVWCVLEQSHPTGSDVWQHKVKRFQAQAQNAFHSSDTVNTRCTDSPAYAPRGCRPRRAPQRSLNNLVWRRTHPRKKNGCEKRAPPLVLAGSREEPLVPATLRKYFRNNSVAKFTASAG